jgi:hypothetical protein
MSYAEEDTTLALTVTLAPFRLEVAREHVSSSSYDTYMYPLPHMTHGRLGIAREHVSSSSHNIYMYPPPHMAHGRLGIARVQSYPNFWQARHDCVCVCLCVCVCVCVRVCARARV